MTGPESIWSWLKGDPAIRRKAICPPEEALGSFMEGTLDPSLHRGIQEHLRFCSFCHAGVEAQKFDEETVPQSTQRSPFFGRRTAAWAASLLLALGAGVSGWFGFQAAGEPVQNHGISFTLLQAGEQYTSEKAWKLHAGSDVHLELASGSSMKCLSRESGERIRLRMDRGELRAKVENSTHRLEIEVPGGILRDIGTEFTVRVRETRLPWDDSSRRPIRITVVETTRGVVELQNHRGSLVQSDSSRMGYLIEGADLFVRRRPVELEDGTLLQNLRSLRTALAQKDEKGALVLWAVLLENAARDPQRLVRLLKDEQTVLSREETDWAVRLFDEIGIVYELE